MNSSPQLSHRSVPISLNAGARSLVCPFLMATAFIDKYSIWLTAILCRLRFVPETHLHCNRYVPQPEQIVHRMPQVLLAAEIAFSCLHGDVPEKELDLIQFST